MDQPRNILITGAAGYIGGSVLADLRSRKDGAFNGVALHAVVRTDDQVNLLGKLGVNVLKCDLRDTEAVTNVVEQNHIDIIVHIASSIDHSMLLNLLQALQRRKAAANTPVYFIHSSVTTWYSEEAGWPFGALEDNDSIYEKEKKLDIPHPVRECNVLLVEKAKEYGITSFNIVVPNMYGRGMGEGRKVSILIPALIQASVTLRKVMKFDKDGHPPAAHVSDLVSLYGIVVQRILQNDHTIPSGKDGYYFAQGHRAPWWAYMGALADSLYARGLVKDSKVETWPSDEAAAQALHFPALYVRAMGTASGGLKPVNAYSLGWKPRWDEQKFLEHADEEVEAVLSADAVRTSLFDEVMTDGTN